MTPAPGPTIWRVAPEPGAQRRALASRSYAGPYAGARRSYAGARRNYAVLFELSES